MVVKFVTEKVLRRGVGMVLASVSTEEEANGGVAEAVRAARDENGVAMAAVL